MTLCLRIPTVVLNNGSGSAQFVSWVSLLALIGLKHLNLIHGAMENIWNIYDLPRVDVGFGL